ncbi:helix-turn-helix domain-containing protein [Bifidobacterium sp. ESL0784]|uniref:helix-turn-helix domain-containing protein n=1 Tax=Bifidobacterium sp. ESL0784 TaxID=2983231 RepID=UPI0023F99959|nr:helix-turn-helix domain-containing protein [Bifidobacterium sp. ESL0784]MDF7640207.1 helix-turn-helix domain-containing protein [Bifidobacterium sp. ESL0784]
MDMFKTQIRSIPQLSATLRDARKAKGLTQSQLANRTNIPRSWLSRMENGKIKDPSAQKIFSLFRELGITTILQYPPADSFSKTDTSKEPKAPKTQKKQSDNDIQRSESHNTQAESAMGKVTLSELAARGQRKTEAFLEQMAKHTQNESRQSSR